MKKKNVDPISINWPREEYGVTESSRNMMLQFKIEQCHLKTYRKRWEFDINCIIMSIFYPLH